MTKEHLEIVQRMKFSTRKDRLDLLLFLKNTDFCHHLCTEHVYWAVVSQNLTTLTHDVVITY